MGQLFFKKPLQIAIREGRKRTTIRRWNKPRVRAGQRAYTPGLGWLSIEAVETVQLELLNDDDAHADGFDSIALLKQVLLSVYPDHAADGKSWFRVRFSVHTLQARPKRRPTDLGPSLFEKAASE